MKHIYGIYKWASDPKSLYLVLGFPGTNVTGLIFNRDGTMQCLFTIPSRLMTNVEEVGYIYDDKPGFKLKLDITWSKRG